ncbi:FecR domain-containing protein [uncultured Draconibacterium sp.]|uniref:FecR family protein n=1 Tax=uncultured Draconibacterium sp. TaxID=1573823 RepID=UPI002AA772AE|nr:FecR domain-containing protein [uncultured Draconibacterium sp.]
MTKKDNTYELIVKKLTETINEDEERILINELDKNKSIAKSYSSINIFWKKYFPKTKNHSIIQQTEKKLGFTYQDSAKSSTWKWIGIAASILFMVSLVFSINYIIEKRQAPTLNEYSCHAKEIKTLTLSDGTKVWLNSSSLLIASEPFIGDKREVTLFGEAYFEVAPDKEKPFIVETPNLKTQVLGTHFNVVAYPTDEIHEISLFEGKVQLQPNANNNTAILNPGDRAYFNMHTGSLKLIHTDLGKPAQWRDGILRFYDEDLFSISKKLERHFQTRIFIADSVSGNLKYTGEFEEESLERILDLLSSAKTFNYRINNNGIIIESKK